MVKKRYETIKLNGRVFTYDNRLSYNPLKARNYRYTYSTIWNAYEKPSEIKQSIWENWVLWSHMNSGTIWIESRNCFKFTISGVVVNSETGEILGIHITDTNNICWSISE